MSKNRVKPGGQPAQVLEYLQSGKAITSVTAIGLFSCTRLAAVIHALKKQGYKINTIYERGIKGRFARYSLA